MPNIRMLFITIIIRLLVKRACIEKVSEPGDTLVIAPHPDDEILGLGGIIIHTLKSGGKIHLVYLTDGEGSCIWPDQEEIACQRKALTGKVCRVLGVPAENINRLHLSDGNVPNMNQQGFKEAVKSISILIEKIKPVSVFATHSLDYWPQDHVACAQIVKEAVRQSAFKTHLWFYWVWAWYNLRPWQLFSLNYKNILRADIRQYLVLKRELTGIYLGAVTPEGKPWSGLLPRTMVKALDQPFEIIEMIDIL